MVNASRTVIRWKTRELRARNYWPDGTKRGGGKKTSPFLSTVSIDEHPVHAYKYFIFSTRIDRRTQIVRVRKSCFVPRRGSLRIRRLWLHSSHRKLRKKRFASHQVIAAFVDRRRFFSFRSILLRRRTCACIFFF